MTLQSIPAAAATGCQHRYFSDSSGDELSTPAPQNTQAAAGPWQGIANLSGVATPTAWAQPGYGYQQEMRFLFEHRRHAADEGAPLMSYSQHAPTSVAIVRYINRNDSSMVCQTPADFNRGAAECGLRLTKGGDGHMALYRDGQGLTAAPEIEAACEEIRAHLCLPSLRQQIQLRIDRIFQRRREQNPGAVPLRQYTDPRGKFSPEQMIRYIRKNEASLVFQTEGHYLRSRPGLKIDRGDDGCTVSRNDQPLTLLQELASACEEMEGYLGSPASAGQSARRRQLKELGEAVVQGRGAVHCISRFPGRRWTLDIPGTPSLGGDSSVVQRDGVAVKLDANGLDGWHLEDSPQENVQALRHMLRDHYAQLLAARLGLAPLSSVGIARDVLVEFRSDADVPGPFRARHPVIYRSQEMIDGPRVCRDRTAATAALDPGVEVLGFIVGATHLLAPSRLRSDESKLRHVLRRGDTQRQSVIEMYASDHPGARPLGKPEKDRSSVGAALGVSQQELIAILDDLERKIVRDLGRYWPRWEQANPRLSGQQAEMERYLRSLCDTWRANVRALDP